MKHSVAGLMYDANKRKTAEDSMLFEELLLHIKRVAAHANLDVRLVTMFCQETLFREQLIEETKRREDED